MPDAAVAAGPHTGGGGLVAGQRIAVVHVQHGVDGRGQIGDLHPGHQLAGGAVEILDLMAELGGAVRGCEDDVVAIVLGIGRQLPVVGQADQHRKVGLVGRDLGVVDRDRFAELPVALGKAHASEDDRGIVGNGGGVGRAGDGGGTGRDAGGQRGGVGAVAVVRDQAERAQSGVEQDSIAAGGQVVAEAVLELHGDCRGGGPVSGDGGRQRGDERGGRIGPAEGAVQLLAAEDVESGGRGGGGLVGGGAVRRGG